MYDKKQRPSWWLLYLSLPMMIGLALIETHLSLSDTGHRLAEIIIVLVTFGYMWIWLNANAGALIQEDLVRWRAAVRTESSSVTPRAVAIVRIDENPNRQPRQVRDSIFRRLARLSSVIPNFFHRRETPDVKQIRP